VRARPRKKSAAAEPQVDEKRKFVAFKDADFHHRTAAPVALREKPE
jgi:hypothetical protein